MKKLVIVMVSFAIVSGSCHSKKGVVTDKQTIENERKEVVGGCADYERDIIWSEAPEVIIKKLTKVVPSASKVFMINESKLQRLFEIQVKKNEPFTFVVPTYQSGKKECVYFAMENSKTISREKQMEIGHFSFKGRNTQNDVEVSRFDYNASTGLRGYLLLSGASYLFEPIKIGGNTYYVTYNKKDAIRDKQDFEIR